jgi:hypothetical protein
VNAAGTHDKINIELTERDAGLLFGLLSEKVDRIPSGLRSRSPWTRLKEQVAKGLAANPEMGESCGG